MMLYLMMVAALLLLPWLLVEKFPSLLFEKLPFLLMLPLLLPFVAETYLMLFVDVGLVESLLEDRSGLVPVFRQVVLRNLVVRFDP